MRKINFPEKVKECEFCDGSLRPSPGGDSLHGDQLGDDQFGGDQFGDDQPVGLDVDLRHGDHQSGRQRGIRQPAADSLVFI